MNVTISRNLYHSKVLKMKELWLKLTSQVTVHLIIIPAVPENIIMYYTYNIIHTYTAYTMTDTIAYFFSTIFKMIMNKLIIIKLLIYNY